MFTDLNHDLFQLDFIVLTVIACSSSFLWQFCSTVTKFINLSKYIVNLIDRHDGQIIKKETHVTL